MVTKIALNSSDRSEGKIEIMRFADNKTDANAAAAGSGLAIATPSSGKTVRLLAIDLSASAAVSLRFHTASGTCYRTPKLAADTPYTRILASGIGFKADDAGALTVTSDSAANLTGTVEWCEE